MPWGNVYAGGPSASDSDFARALTDAMQVYAVPQRRWHSPPSKLGAYGPPDTGEQGIYPPNIAEALAYLNDVSESETKANAAEARTSPTTQKVLQVRRSQVRKSRGLEQLTNPQEPQKNRIATLPSLWYDKSYGGGSGLLNGELMAPPKSPWQKFFTTLGDLFSGNGDESFASYEKMMSNSNA